MDINTKIPHPLPKDFEVAEYVIRIHNSMGGGFQCDECGLIDTCWPTETHWFKMVENKYLMEQHIVCDICGKSHLIRWTQHFQKGAK